MPVFAALLALAAGVIVYMIRARNAAYAARELADMATDVLGAARRFAFRRKAEMHPVESIEDPRLAAAALSVAFFELSQLPSSEERTALQHAISRHLARDFKESEDMMVLGHWLVAQCGTPQAAIARLARRLSRLDRAGQFQPLMAVLNETAQALGGGLSARQREALAEISQQLNLR